jgi:glucose-1-phosphate adenylyltransferase
MSPASLVRHTLVVTLGGGQGERLYPLTRDRAKPAVPFGGLYRIVDFTLSNCLNSGLRRVYVLTQYKSFSLERHLRAAWNLFREELGECLVCVPPQQRSVRHWYLGTADAVFQNIYTLQQERPERVLILAGDHLYKMDYARMLAFHAEKAADLTIACVPVPRAEGRRFGVMQIEADGRVAGFQEKPNDPVPMPDDPSHCLASMGIYAFQTETLVHAVTEDAKRDSNHDFGRDIIPEMIHKRRVFAVSFQDIAPAGNPYWRDIGTLDAYWQANMDLVGPSPAFSLYDDAWPIRSHYTQQPPARSLGGAEIRDSLISVGATVDGARIERSVIGPGVHVGPGVEVSESVVFDSVAIGAGCQIRRAVVDKLNRLPPGVSIGYNRVYDERRFTVTEGGIVVIPKEAPTSEQFWKEGP